MQSNIAHPEESYGVTVVGAEGAVMQLHRVGVRLSAKAVSKKLSVIRKVQMKVSSYTKISLNFNRSPQLEHTIDEEKKDLTFDLVYRVLLVKRPGKTSK